jgi:8-oxo-dGTP pyrophosphatase MutT (NUDIX family)
MHFLHRLGYRAVYRLLQAWWFVRRPETQGAAVAVWQDGALLLVRTSYRPELDLPGGGIHGGESPLAAAVRELLEETGLRAEASELAPCGKFRFVGNHRRITAHLYLWRPVAPVTVVVDHREIVWAGFIPSAGLAKARLAILPRLYLARLAGQVPSGTRQISRA